MSPPFLLWKLQFLLIAAFISAETVIERQEECLLELAWGEPSCVVKVRNGVTGDGIDPSDYEAWQQGLLPASCPRKCSENSLCSSSSV